MYVLFITRCSKIFRNFIIKNSLKEIDCLTFSKTFHCKEIQIFINEYFENKIKKIVYLQL